MDLSSIVGIFKENAVYAFKKDIRLSQASFWENLLLLLPVNSPLINSIRDLILEVNGDFLGLVDCFSY